MTTKLVHQSFAHWLICRNTWEPKTLWEDSVLIHYEVHVCFPEWTAAFSSVHFLHSFLTILSWSCLVICTFIIATIMLDLLCSQSWYCWQQLPSYNKDCKFWGEHCSLLVCILQECQPPQASSVGFLSWSGLLKCTIRKMELSEHS